MPKTEHGIRRQQSDQPAAMGGLAGNSNVKDIANRADSNNVYSANKAGG